MAHQHKVGHSRGTQTPRGTKFCHKKLETLRQPRWRFRSPSLQRFDTIQQRDGRTNRQTNRRPSHG